MQKITPFLWFDNQAEDAAQFYTSIFKNSKINHVARYAKDTPGTEGSVMTVGFELDGQSFAALNGGPMFAFTEAISFVVNCDTQAEIDEYWAQLCEGGSPSRCGWLKDKFGVSWQIVPTQLPKLFTDPEKSYRVMQALLQMTKLDIEALQRAYNSDADDKPSSAKTFSVTRAFDAPRELVFNAWTESERLSQWWGPSGFDFIVGKLELRPGGIFHYCMRTPDGQEMWGRFVYRRIEAPESIVFVTSFADADGNPVRNPFNPNWPLEVLSTVTFTERDGKTVITLEGYPINATAAETESFNEGCESMQQGFAGTFDRLTEYLAKS